MAKKASQKAGKKPATSGERELVNTGTDDVGTAAARATSYVRRDDSGAMRIAAGDVPLDSVVAAFHQGHSPEMIRRQYPSLTLEEVYGAIAYYLANRHEVDAYLKRQDALWEQWRAQSNGGDAPVVRRLRSGARTSPTGAQDRK